MFAVKNLPGRGNTFYWKSAAMAVMWFRWNKLKLSEDFMNKFRFENFKKVSYFSTKCNCNIQCIVSFPFMVLE